MYSLQWWWYHRMNQLTRARLPIMNCSDQRYHIHILFTLQSALLICHLPFPKHETLGHLVSILELYDTRMTLDGQTCLIIIIATWYPGDTLDTPQVDKAIQSLWYPSTQCMSNRFISYLCASSLPVRRHLAEQPTMPISSLLSYETLFNSTARYQCIFIHS